MQNEYSERNVEVRPATTHENALLDRIADLEAQLRMESEAVKTLYEQCVVLVELQVAWHAWAQTWARTKSTDPDAIRLSIAAQVEERDRLRSAVEHMLVATEEADSRDTVHAIGREVGAALACAADGSVVVAWEPRR